MKDTSFHKIENDFEQSIKPVHGQILLGTYYCNYGDLRAQYTVGTNPVCGIVRGCPVVLDTSLSDGVWKFVDSDGNIVAQGS